MIEARGISKSFAVGAGLFGRKRPLHALHDIRLAVGAGEVLGVVGESGCGKSTLARILLGLIPPSAGTVTFDGVDIRQIGRRKLGGLIQPVFQDPYSSLNPRQTVADIVGLPIEVHGTARGPELRREVEAILERVGLSAGTADRYPNELSGGQRQRVAIARALIIRPRVVICDEPTSALDVSVQSQILNLLKELGRERGLTYVFISHNLAVVRHIATRVAVMYFGRVVEMQSAQALFRSPQHPYTRALLASVLSTTPGAGIPAPDIEANFPDPLSPPGGCAFHPRCPHRIARCSTETPAPDGLDGVFACHLIRDGRFREEGAAP